VRNGFHRPDHVKGLSERHRFGVHAEEFGVGAGFLRGTIRDVHLDRRDRNARRLRLKLLRQVDAACAEAATDIQDRSPWADAGYLCEVLDELLLSPFL
jgi:hypothetical protein